MRPVGTAAVGALLAGALLGSCGDDDNTNASDEPTTSSPQETDVLELDAEVPERVEAGPVTWTLEVTNVTDEDVTVTFPTSQEGEAVLSDDADEVVHRWSDAKMFTQRIEEVTFAPGQTRTYELDDDLSGVDPGTYEVVLELALDHPPEAITETIEVVAAG